MALFWGRDNRPMKSVVRPAASASAALVALLGLAACSPSLDWREVRPEGSGLVGLLPCRPSVYERKVRLAGPPVPLSLHACSADGLTFALAFADVGDPARVAAALAELQAAALANVGAGKPQPLALTVPGATPNPASARLRLAGQLPDGKAVEEQVAVFSLGTRVFQATVVGPQLPAEVVDTFFRGLRLAP
jgi:hypothetical protein